MTESNIYVPEIDSSYVSWGDHIFLRSIVERGSFFPVYVAGESGTGKSIMVEQVCAELYREYCRIQITPETDEDQLIGGIRIKDGSTTFQDGPVVEAMRRGAILMIDEIDRGSNKIMCLQAVMEGKPITIKRTGEVVYPAPGFNVIATGNTKGRGDETGKYMAAVIIDDAFLERFPVVLKHSFPDENTEEKILRNHMNKFDCEDDIVTTALLRWARKSRNGDDDEAIISTRRMCLIAESFSFFKDIEEGDITAVEYATNRFEEADQGALLQSYKSIRPDVAAKMEAKRRQEEIAGRIKENEDDYNDIAEQLIADYEAAQL